MRVIVVVACLCASACGGDGGGGPTTSHDMVGSWSYEMPNMQDGHGLTCVISGPVLTLAQAGVTFSGSVTGGNEDCTFSGGSFSNPMGNASVVDGEIHGDSLSFNINSVVWRSVGVFVTPDSIEGTVNSIASYQGTQYYLVGRFYSRRQ